MMAIIFTVELRLTSVFPLPKPIFSPLTSITASGTLLVTDNICLEGVSAAQPIRTDVNKKTRIFFIYISCSALGEICVKKRLPYLSYSTNPNTTAVVCRPFKGGKHSAQRSRVISPSVLCLITSCFWSAICHQYFGGAPYSAYGSKNRIKL